METMVYQEEFSTEVEDGINGALRGTAYYFNREGLWLDTDKGPRKISNFVIIPQTNIIKESGMSSERFVEVLGYTTFGFLPAVTLETGQYESMNWMTKKWGLSVTVELPRKRQIGTYQQGRKKNRQPR